MAQYASLCVIFLHICGKINGEFTTIVPAKNVTIILDALLDGYDKRLRPNYGGQAVDINVNMMIYSFGPITESNMEYTMDFYFRQEWFDPRLTFDHEVVLDLTSEVIDLLWVPDTYFINEKSAKYHEVTLKNSLLKISRDGSLFFSTRITMTASCSMDLKLFPFDHQVCSLTLESYAYNTHSVRYYWLNDNPVWLDPKISLSQFDLEANSVDINTATYSVGNYSQLIVSFYLGRQVSYYIIQTYIPSTIIVILSWISFWIPRKATPARVALGITTVLTMTTIMGNAGSSLPKLSYVKAIDIFLGVCHIYVFAALVEFAIISYYDSPSFEQARQSVKEARGKKDDREEMNQRDHSSGTSMDVRIPLTEGHIMRNNQVTVNNADENILQKCTCSTFTMCRKKFTETGFEPGSTEHNARVMFPLSFVIFQAVYWIYYVFITPQSNEEVHMDR